MPTAHCMFLSSDTQIWSLPIPRANVLRNVYRTITSGPQQKMTDRDDDNGCIRSINCGTTPT
jgi:hypothetical protein